MWTTRYTAYTADRHKQVVYVIECLLVITDCVLELNDFYRIVNDCGVLKLHYYFVLKTLFVN